MKIFELHFNPKGKEKFCESFYHNPESAYQRRVGRLYMIGELSETQPSESSLLSNIFHSAREKYYEDISLPPEKALKEALKEINRIIEERGCRERISIVMISSKNFLLHLGKIGGSKVFLISEGKVADIGKELEIGGSRLFRNIVSGKMKKNDKVVALTPDIQHPFSREKVLEDMVGSDLDERYMEKISSLQKKKFPEVNGVSLIIDYSVSIKEESKVISPKPEEFSFKKTFSSLVAGLSLRAASVFERKKKTKKTPKIPKMPNIKGVAYPKSKLLYLPLVLLIVLLIGTAVISIEERARENKQREVLARITENIEEGKDDLRKGDSESAFYAFEKSLSELETMARKRTRILGEIEEVKNGLEEYLYVFYLREETDNLVLVGEVTEMIPEQVAYFEKKIYLFSPKSNNMIIIDTENEEQQTIPLPVKNGIKLSSVSSDGIFLFSSPNTLINIKNEGFVVSKTDPPYENHSFSAVSSFIGNPYLLEKEKGEILFYGERSPLIWIKEGEKRLSGAKGMAIDGSIFILDAESKVHRYHTGTYREKIEFFIYPPVIDIKKIHTGINAPLFLFEPSEKRVIVLNKNGELSAQIYYKNLEEISDITISSDAKKIYLLSGQKVYMFEL